jgi:hypothetical protein
MTQEINELLDQYPQLLNLNFKSIPIEELLLKILESDSIFQAANKLKVEERSLESYIRRHIKPIFPGKPKCKWNSYLLFLINKRLCKTCNKIKSLQDYHNDKSSILKLAWKCKDCDSNKCKQYRRDNKEYCNKKSKLHYEQNKQYYITKSANYKAYLINAIPAWADLQKISDYYSNKPLDMEIDHIYPLRSDWVCGLHVIENLQYLSPIENKKKSNLFHQKYHKIN